MFRNYPSMPPGAIIGYRKSGQPIRLLAGGSETATEATPVANAGQEGAPAVDGGAQQDQGAGQEGAAGASDGTGADLTASLADADKTHRTIQAIREDFKAERSRRQATEKQLADLQSSLSARESTDKERNLALARYLGYAPEESPTPEQLQEKLSAEQARTAEADARARSTAVELAVLREAAQSGANGNALLDSRAFIATVAGLDPASPDFRQQVGDAIAKATEGNPAWKTTVAAPAMVPPPLAAPAAPAAPVPARSGGEHTSPGGNRQWTIEDVRAASKGNPQAVADAIEQGLLVNLGYSPTQNRR